MKKVRSKTSRRYEGGVADKKVKDAADISTFSESSSEDATIAQASKAIAVAKLRRRLSLHHLVFSKEETFS